MKFNVIEIPFFDRSIEGYIPKFFYFKLFQPITIRMIVSMSTPIKIRIINVVSIIGIIQIESNPRSRGKIPIAQRIIPNIPPLFLDCHRRWAALMRSTENMKVITPINVKRFPDSHVSPGNHTMNKNMVAPMSPIMPINPNNIEASVIVPALGVVDIKY